MLMMLTLMPLMILIGDGEIHVDIVLVLIAKRHALKLLLDDDGGDGGGSGGSDESGGGGG